MKIFTIFVIIMLGGFVLMYLGGAIETFWHERAHQQIYALYHIKSNISLDYYPPSVSGEVISEKPCESSECLLAHNLNEVIGYTSSGLITNLWLMLFIFMMFLYVMFHQLKRTERRLKCYSKK